MFSAVILESINQSISFSTSIVKTVTFSKLWLNLAKDTSAIMTKSNFNSTSTGRGEAKTDEFVAITPLKIR